MYLPNLNNDPLSVDLQTILNPSQSDEDILVSKVQKSLPSQKTDMNKQKIKQWMHKMEKKYSKSNQTPINQT